MVYEVWVEFNDDDGYIENQHIGTFTTERKANKAIEQAWQKIEREDIENVSDVVMYEKELDKNYWE